MSRWADSTDDDDDYLQEGEHEDYVEHAVGADEVSVCFTEDDSEHDSFIHSSYDETFENIESNPCLSFPFLPCVMPF
jgi:hypothetical protein